MKGILFLVAILFFNIATAQLSGTYTIDPKGSGNNFTSFKQAESYLASYGVNGPTVFKVADGIYTEKITLGMISGASAKNTITFESASSDSSKVVLTSPSSTSSTMNYTLYLVGATYLTFRNMTFERSGSSEFGRVIVFDQGSNKVTFQNNRILAANNGSTTTACFYSATYADSNNVFINNYLKYGFYGFYFSSGNNSIYENNNIISGNLLDSQFVSGIHLLLQNSCTVNNNKVTNLRSGSYNNYSIYGIYLDRITGSVTKPNLIFNNIASMNAVAVNAYGYGIYMTSCSNTLIAHNNILIEIPGTSTGRALYVNQSSTVSANNNIYNNNFIVKGKGYPVEVTSNGKYGISNSDYNNLYSTNGIVARIGSTDYLFLSTWKTATGFESKGISTNPRYFSFTDLHVRAVQLNEVAKPLSLITNDYDGEIRSSSSPDIGADEFVPFSNDIELVDILAPVQESCGDSFSRIAAIIKNQGVDTQTNFYFEGVLSGNGTDTLLEKYTSKIASLAVDTLYFKSTINTYNGGTFNLKVFSKLSSDEYKWNDTATRSFLIRAIPKAPTTTNDVRCGTGKVTLKATGPGSETISWYNSLSSSKFLDTGTSISFITAKTTTVYAQYGGDYFYRVGPRDTTIGSAAYYSAYSALPTYLKVYKTMHLDSVTVYSDGAGDVVFRLMDSSTNNVVAVAKQSVTGTGKHVISVGLKIEPGSYKIDASGTTTSGLLRNSTGASWPYKLNNIMSITGTAYQFSYYYFFYNWKVSVRTCPSPRVPVIATINDLPTGGALEKDSIFEGVYKSGYSSEPDSVCTGKRLDYKLIPPTGYNNKDFDSSWKVNLTIQTTTGATVNDTTFRFPSLDKNGVLSIIPASSLIDKTINIKIKFINLLTGCEQFLNRYVYVSPVPTAGFTADTVCFGKPTPIRTTASTSSGYLIHIYRMNNDSIIEKPSFKHTYLSPGKYSITQIVVNTNGCIDSTTRIAVVNPMPLADFNFNESCVGTSLQFINKSSIKEGNINYVWNLGDGTNTTDTEPIHTYYKSGTFYVTLQAITEAGCVNSITKAVTVKSSPIADFTSISTCKSNYVQFENKSNIVDDSTAKYFWIFDDGNTSDEKSPLHLYDSTGTYSVTLITQSNGCMDSIVKLVDVNTQPIAGFTFNGACKDNPVEFKNQSTSKDGSALSYTWYFGDGDSSSEENPYHEYKKVGKFNVKLIAVSENGCQDTLEYQIEINSSPNAGFTYTINEKTVEFNPIDTNYNNYKWYFGDGDSSVSKIIKHTYGNEGQFKVTLNIKNQKGCSQSFTDSIIIKSSDLQEGKTIAPSVYVYPNPFTNQLYIKYNLKKSDYVQIYLCDINGRPVCNIVNKIQLAGSYIVDLKSKKESISPGTYILFFKTNEQIVTTKVIYLSKK